MTVASMADRDGAALPDQDIAKEFYAKYELRDVLGMGVSSTVRKCVEKATQLVFAVKIIDLTGDKETQYQMDEYREATKREIDVLRMCAQHPHIIELHDTFESSAFMFLVFEICQKGELFDYLTDVVTLSEKRTRMIMRQLLEAVQFVHKMDIVHRDLKPENILLDDNLNVKLSDFGFATIINNGEDLNELCGTPGYLAPEVLKASMYDDAPGYGKEVDIWACGVIMYTLLVGCPPFWHRKQMYMLRSIMEGEYSFENPEWNDISDPPKDLISKMLVTNVQDRYTASEALAHPFLKYEERKEEKRFFPRRKFRAAIHTVIATHRIRSLHLKPQVIAVRVMHRDPYSERAFRRIIDSGAFKIYGHWVKRGDSQNRAALFDNTPKRDLKLVEAL